MPLKIFDSKSGELLCELTSYSVSHWDVTGVDIIWAIWTDAPFSSPSEQKEAFTIHLVDESGKEKVFEDGWLKDVSGTRPNVAVRIVSRKRGDA